MRLAVNRVSLSVLQGELFGLLGPNGAGKTTLIKMLSTLILPTSGTARVNGYALNCDTAIKSTIGLVTSDERSFYWRLTGRQNLEFFASLHGLFADKNKDRINEVLEIFDLSAYADERFLTYSTGIRQRLSIARALINQPKILFLDEPTKGLDPDATHKLHQLIRQRLTNQLGLTVFLTTHNLTEAQALCDRIAIMHQGTMRACGTITELRSSLQAGRRYILHVNRLTPESATALTQFDPDINIQTPDPGHTSRITPIENDHPAILRLPTDTHPARLNLTIDWLRKHQVEIGSAEQENLLWK